MIQRVITHRPVQSSACAGIVLAALSSIGIPWPLWVVWAALSAVAVAQALRSA